MDWIEMAFRVLLVIVSILSTLGIYWIQRSGSTLSAIQEKLSDHSVELAEFKNELRNNKEQHTQQQNKSDRADVRITRLERDQSAILSQLQTVNESLMYIRTQIDEIKERV